MTESRNARWQRRAMMMTLTGLVVELFSFFGLHHPLGFLLFAVFGGTLIGAGVLVFVYALVA